MSQNTETTRAAIVALLNTVPNTGVVHAYERYAKDMTTLRKLYTVQTIDGERLHGWFVRRLSARTTRSGPGRPEVVTQWFLRGLRALTDAEQSEVVFDEVIDDVRRAIYDNPTLGGAVMSTFSDNKEVGAQLQASGPVMFAGVLCHCADLVLNTQTLE